MYFLKKEKGRKDILFWAMLLMLLGSILQILGSNSYPMYMHMVFESGAYMLFFVYFYKETYSRLTDKIVEADMKLKAVDRSLNLEVKKRVFEIERSNEKLMNITKTDSLTGALNKAAIFELMEKLMNSRSRERFSIFMFDIDGFKGINDTYGHVTGDKCLRKLALMAKSSIRDIDSFGRYGGDEFIIVLPDTSIPQATHIAERFRKRVDESESPHFTISVGIACYPDDATSAMDMIVFADKGLYISKNTGKNRVSHCPKDNHR